MPSGIYIRKQTTKNKLKVLLNSYKNTKKWKENFSKSKTGRNLSDETKIKIKDKRKLQVMKPVTEKTRKKLSVCHSKDKHWNWQGGISYQPYPKDWNKMLRESIRLRDNYTCQECGIKQEKLNNGRIKKLSVHHIDYNKNNLDPNNLITLCISCHQKTNYNREKWIKYFNNKLIL